MVNPAHKILLFMKRRPGMTMAAFIDYYENRHVPLVLRHSAGLARYVRRYLTPHPNPETGEDGELPFDVVTELWFPDEPNFRRTLAYLSTHVMPADVVEDERALFDRPRLRMATVIEHETPMPG